MNTIRFGVYEHKIVYNNEQLIRRQLIVLKDQDGDIVGWTDFDKYTRSGKKSFSRSIFSGQDSRSFNVSLLLNYIFFDKYHITKLTDITEEMVRSFLTDYGLCRLPRDTEKTHRGKEAVNSCISQIMDFLDLLTQDNPTCKLKVDNLYRTEKVFNRKRKRYEEKRVPTFEINHIPNNRKILRDLPEKAFQIIFNEIIENHRDLLMLAALSAFAGLRPSESCNVRRPDSALGPGIRFEITDGEVTNVLIDLSAEKNLRSDLVAVGAIKKERIQKVYPAFLEAFMDCYNLYMKYVEKPVAF